MKILEIISKRLTALEAIQEKNTYEQNVRQPVYDREASDSDIVNDDNSRPNNGGSTQSIDLDSACARDNLKEFAQIRERLARVSLPNELKVKNITGIKSECRPAQKIISKSLRKARLNHGIMEVTKQERDNLFIISAVNVQFAQAAYADIAVKIHF